MVLNATYILKFGFFTKNKNPKTGAKRATRESVPREGRWAEAHTPVHVGLHVYARVKEAVSENSGRAGASCSTCPGLSDHVKQGKWHCMDSQEIRLTEVRLA